MMLLHFCSVHIAGESPPLHMPLTTRLKWKTRTRQMFSHLLFTFAKDFVCFVVFFLSFFTFCYYISYISCGRCLKSQTMSWCSDLELKMILLYDRSAAGERSTLSLFLLFSSCSSSRVAHHHLGHRLVLCDWSPHVEQPRLHNLPVNESFSEMCLCHPGLLFTFQSVRVVVH